MNVFQNLVSREVETNPKFQITSSKMLQNTAWRKLVVQWYFDVIDRYEYDRDVGYAAISIFDRFLAIPKSAKRASDKIFYETSATASLILALRLFTNDLPFAEELLEMTKSCISTIDVRNACIEIYGSVDWETLPPAPTQFAKAMIGLLPSSVSELLKNHLLQSVLYNLELSVQDELCMSLPPSLLAWMALENAFDIIDCCSYDDKCNLRCTIISMTGHSESLTLRRRLQRLHNEDKHPDIIPVRIAHAILIDQ